MQISDIPPVLSQSFEIGVCVVALWRGGPHERVVAALLLWMLGRWLGFYDVHEFVLDGVSLLACVACVLQSRSYWTIWCCAGFLLSVLTHLVFYVRTDVDLWAYRSAELLWSYVSATALLCGALVWRSPRNPRRPRTPAGRVSMLLASLKP